MDPQDFVFRFDPAYRRLAAVFGVTPARTALTVGPSALRVRFGPWRVSTPLTNIVEATVTGPYAFVRTAGPARLSLSDRGLTLATNGERGVCLTFREPIRGMEPTGLLRHPNLTVTVADCDGLVALLRGEIDG